MPKIAFALRTVMALLACQGPGCFWCSRCLFQRDCRPEQEPASHA